MKLMLETLDIKTLSFPDAKLHSFTLESDSLIFVCDFFHTDSKGLQDSRIKCSAKGCKNIRISRFDSDGKNPRLIEIEHSGRIHEICECSFDEKSFKLAGFELESGNWQTYELEFSTFTATY